jgi:nucleotide-binding universal stress UspA family protein
MEPLWQRLLFATNFEGETELALDEVQAIARATGSKVTLMNVQPSLFKSWVTSKLDDLHRTSRLELFVERLTAAGVDATTLYTQEVELPEAIVAAAGAEGAIILDGHQRKKGWHLLRRSTIASVLHLARQPVWVSRARHTPPRHLVCGVDCSGSSREALLLAGQLRQRLNARLTVVHAVGTPDSNPLGMTPQEESEQLRAHRRAAEERVLAFVAETGVGAEIRCLWGPPADVILAVVQHEEVDLVLAGSTGRGALARAVLGSTARRLLADCSCSLLLLGERGLDERSSVQ